MIELNFPANKKNDKSKEESEATLKAIIKLDKPKNLGKPVIKQKI